MASSCGDASPSEVDHIIPESLKDRPVELKRVLEQLRLEENFDLNSYRNWMPACRSCNGKKSNFVFEPSLLIQVILQKAKARAPKAEKHAHKLITEKKIDEALNTLHRADEDGELSDVQKARLMPLIEFQLWSREGALKGEPIHVSAVYDVVGENQWVQVNMGHHVRGIARKLHIDILALFEFEHGVYVTARAGSASSASVAVFDTEVRKIARGKGKSIQISWV